MTQTGKLTWVLGTLALLLSVTPLVSCKDGKGQAFAPSALMTVAEGSFDISIEEVGVVSATRVVSIYAPFRGKVISLPETGTMINAGEPVLVLENADALEELQSQLTELKTVKSELEAEIESLMIALRENTLDLDYANSQLQFSRIKLEEVNQRLAETTVLMDRSVVPEDDLRNAQSNVVTGRLDTIDQDLTYQAQQTTQRGTESEDRNAVERHLLRSERARNRLEKAQKKVSSSHVMAPVTGMFLRIKNWRWEQNKMIETRPGDSVREGQVVGEIPDLASLIVKSQISEQDLGRVSKDMNVKLRFDALGGKEIEGRIESIGRVAIQRETSAAGAMMQSEGYTGQKVFEVIVSMADPPEAIRPGLTAQIRIVLEHQDKALSVPVTAVVRRDGRMYVSVVKSGGVVEPREVELGKQGEGRAMVLEGLQPGETILKVAPVSGGTNKESSA